MGIFLLFPVALLSCALLVSGISYSEFLYPNFTASNLQFVDSSGAFLSSRNGTFKAAIFNPESQQTKFYLCVMHEASNTIIWSANRDGPISNSGKMHLTPEGITIYDENGNLEWSTPMFSSPVYAMMLSEMGNLILLDQSNGSLWESFQHPTDTIVMGQLFPVGASLSSIVSPSDRSMGDYNLTLTSSDVLLQWLGQTYWKLSMDTNAHKNSNYMVEYMEVNRTGLYLLGGNGKLVIIQVALSLADFRIAYLESSGRFIVKSFSSSNWINDFGGPSDSCWIPFSCGRIGLCTAGSVSNSCSCPSNFRSALPNRTSCVPIDSSYSLYPACSKSTGNSTHLNSSAVSYLTIGNGYEYFGNRFSGPVKTRVNLTVCQDLCSADCSCLGFLYENSSGDCYWMSSYLGSLISGAEGGNDLSGYIKVLITSSPAKPGGKNKRFPLSALVVLPSSAFALLVMLGFLYWRRQRITQTRDAKSERYNPPSSEDLDAFCIPGLPKRFDYKELDDATDHFRTLIGSGGFGAVYKGMLPDKTAVAVKKITNLGIQGKREFCTEIAVIGNIRHVHLVKLQGFCVHGGVRLLVYEYMNHGSLDRILFRNGPVLEWQERLDIALGTARGLAYLHSGCEHKIIHCDIKPENILLHDRFQAKISDFGLSKLLTPEQSSLFTTMRGTRGYLAPEWLTNSAISEKTDVYSFGMVLLEIVSGRKNCLLRTQSHSLEDSSGTRSSLSSGPGLVYFPLFALDMHEQGRYMELADPRLENRVATEEVEKLVRVALCCVHEEPSLRPSMATVVGMLEGRIPLGNPRMESLNFLRFYGRRFTEASATAEQEIGAEDVLLYSQANASLTNTASSSHKSLSYVSSQQISGPR